MSLPEPDSPPRIDLWLCPTASITLDQVESVCLPLLTAEDIESARQAKRPIAYRQRLLSQAILRYALSISMHTEHPPLALTFGRRTHGKPYLQAPVIAPPIHFNLSHSPDAILVGLSRAGEIGVDIESRSRKVNALSLAKRYFHPNEQSALASVTEPDDTTALFLRMWTLKEAYAKARGLGLKIPLRNIETCQIEGNELALRLHEEPALPRERQWRVYSLQWGNDWAGSVVLDCPRGTQPGLSIHLLGITEQGLRSHPYHAHTTLGVVEHV